MPAPSAPIRIALAQMNPRQGDPAANAARLRALRAEAAGQGAHLLLTPEHSLSGAVPAELAAHPGFAKACEAELAALAADPGPPMLVGAPWRDGPRLHQALHLLEAGAVRTRRAAHHPSPGYDPGPSPGPVAVAGLRLGLMPGADARNPAIAETLAETGADLLVALDSLPFTPGGAERALQSALARVVENDLPLILLHRLGFEGERATDGAALVLNADRTPALSLPPFAERLSLTEWRHDGPAWLCSPCPGTPAMAEQEALWRALLLALREHAARHGAGLLVPLSATPEASLTAALAVDALPPGSLRAVLIEEAAAPIARRLGLDPEAIDLAPAARALAAALPSAPGLAARLHHLAVDALAESEGLAPLSEASRHPAAFAPLRHLSPGQRRALAAWRNAHRPAGLLGPPDPGIPAPGESPPQPPTPWQSLARQDYKRRLLPPGLNPWPSDPRHPNPQEAKAP